MTVAEAREYIAQGQFAPGSMLPKVEACIEYVRGLPEGQGPHHLARVRRCWSRGQDGHRHRCLIRRLALFADPSRNHVYFEHGAANMGNERW